MACVSTSLPFERPNWDEYFMLQAELAKLRSNCISRKVGAVIARDHRQIATGYNGTPPGITNCFEGGCARCQRRVRGEIESGQDLGRCDCSHAEANAIMHCAILGIEASSASETTLYTTYVPCVECTKMAITIGIKRFVCLEPYTEDATHLTDQAGVKIERMNPDAIAKWISKMTAAGTAVVQNNHNTRTGGGDAA